MRIALLSRLAIGTLPLWLVAPDDVLHAIELAKRGCIRLASGGLRKDGSLMCVQALRVTDIGWGLIERAATESLTESDWAGLASDPISFSSAATY